MRRYFTRLYGNTDTKNRIATAIQHKTLPHAFLIDGQEGSGKMTLALEIAAALNCERRSDDTLPLPCGVCRCCECIRGEAFADVRILRRQSDKATIGVDEIKEFRADMFLSATESEYKIYIIKDAERMTPEAQNALLIILEEPPRNVIIMLLASGTDRILTTIKSRTQYIAMSRFAPEEIEAYLSGVSSSHDSDKLRVAALGADGRIGAALKLLSPSESEEYREYRSDIYTFIKALAGNVPYATLYAAVMNLPTKRAELTEMLEGIITAIRDMIVLKRSDASPVFFASREEAEEYTCAIGHRRLFGIYDIINRTHADCAKNANINALITNLAAKIKLT